MLNDRARTLRKDSTDAEKCLWRHLRDRQLAGFKFNRQFVISPYIVDFVCREKMLIIELDGEQHLEQAEYDDDRTYYLESKGYSVLRFWNDEFLKNQQGVLELILETLLFIKGNT